MKKLLIAVMAPVLVLSFSLVAAVPAMAGPWDAELRAEITSPTEGEWIAPGSTFTVAVTIYNDGTDNAEAVDVDCVLNGGWPAGEYPDPENLAFAEGETQHKSPPGAWPGDPIEPETSMNFTWDVVCTGPGVAKIRINPSSIGHIGEADTVTFYQGSPPVEVEIDIKPGSDPNSINLGSNGVVPVAILGSASFDVTTVDPSTVVLSGATVKVKGKSGNAGSYEDVNGDGFTDLVVQVYTSELEPGDGTAELTGETYGGPPIHGTDSVRVVPPE